jgi:hypothetical protein
MPSYPKFPFVPAGSDGIDEDGLPNDWFVPANPGAVGPNNTSLPTPAAAPNPAAPNPQPSAAAFGLSNQPAPPRPDPLAAYWSLIPASRVGALAWAPPIFPSSNPFAFQNIPAPPLPFSLNSPRQFPSATPVPLDDVPPAAANGLFGNTIGRMLAARAKPYDPFEAAANGMWGGIAKMIAANAAPDPNSRGFLGSLADLPVPPSAQPATYTPYSGPFLPSDPIGFPQSGALPDIDLIADKTKGPRNLDLFDERAFGTTPPLGSAAPRLVPPFGSGPVPPAPRPLTSPPASAPQPPLRPSLTPESSLPLGALPSPSPGQGATSAGPPGAPIGTAPALVPAQQSAVDDGNSAGGSGDGPSSNGAPSGAAGPNITKPYSRPPNATTRQQRASVQGQPCVNCGVVGSRMYANHIEPLVQQYYRTGTIDTTQMRSLDAVNAQCPTCSARQGGFMANFSKFMKDLLGL